MRYLSVCSGIEAATVAWHSLGWTPVAFSEIEPFPSAVLAHHYPEVRNLGDMTKYEEWPDEPVDLLVGGTPCQSFSVAGLRKGLSDPRGGLMLTYLEIARRYRPRWVVWENVPGVLSSNGGRDFGSFLGALGELGYGFAYRVLDAQWFGVAQRRRRVFVVGYLGDWRRAAAVLFERESVRRDTPPSREAGQEVAGTIAARFGISRNNHEECVPAVAETLIASDHKGPGHNRDHNFIAQTYAKTHKPMSSDDPEGWSPIEASPTITHWPRDRSDAGTDVAVVQAIPIHDQATRFAGKRGNKQDGKGNGFGVGLPGDPAPTLTKADKHAVAHTLRAEYDASEDGTGRGTPLVPVAFGVSESDAIAHCLRSGASRADKHESTTYIAQPVAFSYKDSGDDASDNVSPTLRSLGAYGANGGGQMAVAQPVVYQDSQFGVGEYPTAGSLRAGRIPEHQMIASPAMQVRRLTPTECERLQGFPDGYTNIPWRKSPEAPDGPRYKSLGNSMAVPVMHWIGRRIAKQDQQ